MKSYFFILLCCALQINAMEKQTVPELMIHLGTGCNMYQELALGYLNSSGIKLQNKYVLDLCSNTGETSCAMIPLVGRDGLVMGVDADQNMISFANNRHGKYHSNLSFHHDSLEKLEASSRSIKFNVATLFNFFNVLENKREVCKKIHDCLCLSGELLVNVASGKEPFDLQVTREMINDIPFMGKLLVAYGLGKALERPYPTDEEYKIIFNDSGFDIISFKKKRSSFIFKAEELTEMKRPIVMNSPEMKMLPSYIQGWVFNSFITKFLNKLEKTEEDLYIYPIEEILIYARKMDKK